MKLFAAVLLALAAACARGQRCGSDRCHAPETCHTVVGMQPDSIHKECYVSPHEADDGGYACPPGYTFDFVDDGEGPICEPNASR